MRKRLIILSTALSLTVTFLAKPANAAIVGTVSAISGPVALPIWFGASAVGITPGVVLYAVGVAIDRKNAKESGESTDSFAVVGGLGAGLGAAFLKLGGIVLSIAGLGIALDESDTTQIQFSQKYFESTVFEKQSDEIKNTFKEEVPLLEIAMKQMFQLAKEDKSLSFGEVDSLWNQLTVDLSESSKALFESSLMTTVEMSRL